MPINANYEYYAAEKKYHAAKTPTEKLQALSEMQSTAPKHKGAENLRKEISRKIAAVKAGIEKHKIAKKGSGKNVNVKKEGAGQVAIVGMPNSGKSTFLNKLTGVKVEIASYPFTTRKPEVGMMGYKGAWVQLVEVPAIVEGSSQGKSDGTQILSIIRNSDAVVLLYRTEEKKELVLKELEAANIKLNKQKPKIIISHSEFKGITVSGAKNIKFPRQDLEKFLKSMGYHNASVIIHEPVTNLIKFIEVLEGSIVYKKAILLKFDEWQDNEEFRGEIFSLLEKILIYTKKPGQEADYTDPLVLKEGATVADVAERLHKDFAQGLRYVRVWGSAKFGGQRISRKYKLKSEDLIEIYS